MPVSAPDTLPPRGPQDVLAPRADDPDWLAALRAVAAAHGIAEAGRRVGISRPSASLLLAGRYPAKQDKVAAKVRAALLDSVRCQGLGQDISITRCHSQAARPFSAASSRAAALYRACQSCPHKPQPEKEAVHHGPSHA